MSVFGGMSKGERTRIKIGVRAAVGAQAKDEGRFHGKRLHKLDLDPEAAPVVKRICDCKLAQYRAALDANANSVTVAATSGRSSSGRVSTIVHSAASVEFTLPLVTMALRMVRS